MRFPLSFLALLSTLASHQDCTFITRSKWLFLQLFFTELLWCALLLTVEISVICHNSTVFMLFKIDRCCMKFVLKFLCSRKNID